MSDGDYRSERSGRAEGWHSESDVGFSEPRLRLPVVLDLRDRTDGVQTVLDMGCGIGVYGEMIRGHVPKRLTLYGIDAFEPYLHEYRVRRYYDWVRCADLLDVVEGRIPLEPDCVLCMDVVEHFEKGKALAILDWIERRPLAYVSTPLFFMSQPKLRDNPHEEHRCYFEEKELAGRGWKTIIKTKLSEQGEGGAFRHES